MLQYFYSAQLVKNTTDWKYGKYAFQLSLQIDAPSLGSMLGFTFSKHFEIIMSRTR